MFTIALICVSLAVVYSQDATTAGHTHHPHATHTPAITDHKFNGANPVWFMDATHKVLVLKTDSGCYGLHMTPDQVTAAQTADGLLKLERDLLAHVEHAKAFTQFHARVTLSDEITTACPTILAGKHQEH